MTADASAAWTQLFSVGALWISLHCVGMCGPLVAGLDLGGVARGARWSTGIARALTYQLGKALTYATLGGLAGLVGAGVRASFRDAGAPFAIALGLAIVGTAAGFTRRRRDLVSIGPRSSSSSKSLPREALRALHASLASLARDHRPSRTFALGALLGLLPCMIPMWVLSLSALSGSVLHGAGLMIALVAMTTPLIVGVSVIPRVLRGGLSAIAQSTLPRVLLGVSGIWCVLVGLAAAQWIPHAHTGFTALGRHWLIMFW